MTDYPDQIVLYVLAGSHIFFVNLINFRFAYVANIESQLLNRYTQA